MRVGTKTIRHKQIVSVLRKAGGPFFQSPYEAANAFLAMKGVVPAVSKKGRLLQALQIATGQDFGKLPAMPGGPRAPNRKPRVPKQIDTRVRSKNDKSEFYKSWEWKKLRMQTLERDGRVCACCGAKPEDGIRLVVDHIKPLGEFWHLRLTLSNTQVLCNDCNMGKGNWLHKDFRETPEPEPEPEDEDYLTAQYRATFRH